MKSAPTPPDEVERMAALRNLGVLDTLPDPDFDNLTRLASEICGTPIALICLVDTNRQWFKSKVGISTDAHPREVSFCAHGLDSDELMVVPDAQADERFADNPLVTGEPHIRFYAGAPLVDVGGHILGTLCVIDRQPRVLTEIQAQSLQTLSSQVMMLMQFHRQNREMLQTNASLLSILEDQMLAEKELRESQKLLEQKEALLRMVGRVAAIGGWTIELSQYKVTWSEEMFAILGLAPGPGPSYAEVMAFFEVEARERVESAIQTCKQTRDGFEVEEQMTTADQRVIWVRITGEAVVGRHGVVVAVRGALQDISARKLVEEHIRTQHSQLTIAGRLAKVGAWSLLLSSDVCYWSDEVCAIHGRPPGYQPKLDETINYYVPEARPAITRVFEDCRGKGIPYVVELQITSATGQKIWVSTSGEAVRDERGKIVKVQGAFQDINEPKLAELEISRSREGLIKIVGILQEIAHGNMSQEMLLKLAVKRVREFLESDGASIDLVEGQDLVCMACTGLQERTLLHRVPQTQGPGGVAFTEGESIIWRADEPDERFDTAAVVKSGVRSFIVVPLHEGDARLGLLWAVSQKTGVFTESDLHNIEILAESLSASVLRIKAAEQLRSSEEQYRLLFTSNPMPMWTYDMETRQFLDVNNAAIVHYGYTREEFLQMTVVDLFAQRKSGDLATAVGELTSAGSLSGLSVHRKKSGEIIEVEVSSEPVTFSGKSARLASVQDVTERRRNHQLLLQQATLIDAAPVAIIVQDLNNRIRFWSEGAAQLYGWSKSEAEGKTLLELIKPEAEHYQAARKSVKKQGEWMGEVKKMTKAEETLTVSARWKLQHNEKGEPDSILSIDFDITDRKKLEQQFLRAQRMESIGTLAGGIAHDLNNLLLPIVMGVELLRLGKPSQNEELVIDNIERSARRGTDLVRQVLSFAKGVDGARVAVKLTHIIRDIEHLIESTFPKNINCRTKLPKELPLVMGDPTQLHQVFLNLAVNARDAMQTSGEISFTAEVVEIDQQYAVMNRGVVAGPYVCLNVMDTGSGIAPDMIERIFEPFFTTKELGKGTGLGLSTAIGIVRSHGGFINVYSEVGKGTSFKVYLPVQPHEATGDTPRLFPPDTIKRGNGETILVVDDESSILSITRQTLETFGYRVMTAEDGAQAISIYATNQQSISLVLTDMMMPVMDGPSLIAALRAINPKVPVVAASGLNTNGKIAMLAASGETNFLPKPYSAESLLQMLHKVLHA